MGNSYIVSPVSEKPVGSQVLVSGQTVIAGFVAKPPTNVSAPTVLLPSNPDAGAVALVEDPSANAAVNSITVDGNGNTIDGAANVVLNTNSVLAAFVFDDGEWKRCVPRRRFDDTQGDDAGVGTVIRRADLAGMAL